MILTLCGFMGAGKSGIGRALAAKLRRAKLIDLDGYIEEQNNCSVAEIFAYEGEEYFRKAEYDALNELIIKHFGSENVLILSLGGGTPLNPKAAELIKAKTYCVYLTCSPKELALRLIDTAYKRPVLAKALRACPSADATERQAYLESWIKSALALREPYYKECSMTQVDTTLWAKPEIADEIIRKAGLGRII